VPALPVVSAPMPGAIEQLTKAILGRHSLVFVRTWEEERAVALLESFARKVYGGQGEVWSWSCVQGLSGAPAEAGTTDPLRALRAVVAAASADPPRRGFAIFRDLPAFFDRPEVVRALREAYEQLRQRDCFLFVVSPVLDLPQLLSKETFLVDLALPGEDELAARVQEVSAQYPEIALAPALLDEVTVGLRGLTINEATHLMQRIYRSKKTGRDDVIAELFTEKEAIVKKSGFLEYVPSTTKLEDVGGLDVLKDWLVHRRKLFSRQAVADGMPTPRGILIMGMSGCGKSMCCKVTSTLWGVPLFRLDMNLVVSGLYGTPEAAFHRALSHAEALAPAILWIDEIENSLGYDPSGRSNTSSSIFSRFLTWMQEKPPLLFVAATANRIEDLPAEIIRKGRFDQVFFVDLPSDEERREILEINLRKQGTDPAKFDTRVIAHSTKGWNGAELEQAVIAARVEAYHEGRSAGDVGRAAVHRLEDRAVSPMLAPGTTPRPPTRPAQRSETMSP
jgi:hypothetical protein